MVKPSYPGRPLPIGYIEKQVGGIGHKTPTTILTIANKAIDELLKENPGYEQHGEPRWSILQDGGGVWHWTIYVGVAPIHVAAEPLDNRNLNNAPLPQPDAVPSDDLLPLGHRERKF